MNESVFNDVDAMALAMPFANETGAGCKALGKTAGPPPVLVRGGPFPLRGVGAKCA